MKKCFRNTKVYKLICQMPAGQHHSKSGATFDIQSSEVVQWLVSQPGVLQYLFDKANLGGAIVYDQDTGTWRGKDTK